MRQSAFSFAKRKLSSKQYLSMELYLRNIAKRWKAELSVEAERKLIFSPYVTSSTADSVVRHSGPCEIHTVFSVELFASHASSLETLCLLMDRGHKLFHVTNLHAKVFLIPGQFASIGSQNLTLGGTTNREASVVLQDVKHLKMLEKKLAPWISERTEITRDMLGEMAEIVAEISPLFEAARQAVQAAENQRQERALANYLESKAAFQHQCLLAQLKRLLELQLFEAEAVQKLADEAKRREAEELAAKRRAEEIRRQVRLRQNIQATRKSGSYALLKITEVLNYETGSAQTTMLAENERDLTKWIIGAQPVFLTHGKRYLLLHDTGKMGWAKVVKTRISFIGTGVDFAQMLDVCGSTYKVKMQADRASNPIYGRNVFFNLSTKSNVVCQISCWFDVNGLEILEIEPHPDSKGATFSHQQTIKHLIDHLSELTNRLLTLIIMPFAYSKRDYGTNPRSFFKGTETYILLNAALVKGTPILLSRNAN